MGMPSSWGFQTEQANKEATVSTGSGQAPATEEAVAVSSPALAPVKPAPQPLGPSTAGYDHLQFIHFIIYYVKSKILI